MALDRGTVRSLIGLFPLITHEGLEARRLGWVMKLSTGLIADVYGVNDPEVTLTVTNSARKRKQ